MNNTETLAEGTWKKRGGVLMIMHAIAIRPLTSHPYKAGTEHAERDVRKNPVRYVTMRGTWITAKRRS